MSNHASRKRVITPTHIFPTRTPMTKTELALLKQLAKAKHVAEYRELGPSMGEVDCSCGFVFPCPFGEHQGAKVIEDHYARFHVIHDPLGAKYRD